MIKYPYGAFGVQILFRLRGWYAGWLFWGFGLFCNAAAALLRFVCSHLPSSLPSIAGSAVFKSLLPALISSLIYVFLYHTLDSFNEEREPGEVGIMDHPYPMGALIAAFTYLLSFRANFAYNRYWEAFTSVHSMHSKWLDVGTDLAAFHLQSARYNDNKPPTFGENPHLTSLEREREFHEKTYQEIKDEIEDMHEKQMELNHTSRFSKWRLRRRKNRRSKAAQLLQQQKPQKIPSQDNTNLVVDNEFASRQLEKQASAILHVAVKPTVKNINAPAASRHQNNNNNNNKTNNKFKRKKGKAHRRVVSSVPPHDETTTNGDGSHHQHRRLMEKRPLFLQEAAHLLSLLSAVAMSTLRNDLETAESPLVPFVPGAPFPCVDPDGMTADIREDWESNPNGKCSTARYFCGLNRSETDRALYNAARPFRVIGGISDNEVLLLQAARGPQAKVNLVSFWVQEFISREYLAGSVGKVAPPILSRLYQYVSDGCLHYNQARKVAYIPFPFPHAQITSIFVLVIVAMIPILMLTFVTSELIGFLLNLFTVMCFAGLHEVARELENPFQNAPNDLPANNFHAQYNEALMSMFAGYHPDAYWVVKEDEPTEDDATYMESMNPLDSINLGELVAGVQGGGTLVEEGQELERVATNDNNDDPAVPAAVDAENGGGGGKTTTSAHEMQEPIDNKAWLSAFRGSDSSSPASATC